MQRGASCRTRVLPVRTIDLLVRAGAVHEASGRGFACRALAMSGKWLVGISAEPGGLDQLIDRRRTRVVDVAELLIVPGQPKGVRYALALSASEGAAGGEQSIATEAWALDGRLVCDPTHLLGGCRLGRRPSVSRRRERDGVPTSSGAAYPAINGSAF